MSDAHLQRFPEPTSGKYRDEMQKRLDLIHDEFREGFKFLYGLKKEVTIYGSARFEEDHPYYQAARELAKTLGEAGYTIVTGGGPGIMEAGNRGAQEAGAPSVGLNIELPHEQRVNPYVDEDKKMGFHYFFSRKMMLTASAQAYVVFPGGFGTMDEVFEMMTLIQTKKMERVPVMFYGADFWDGLMRWISTKMAQEHGTISPEDVELFTVVDSVDEVMEIVRKTKEREVF